MNKKALIFAGGAIIIAAAVLGTAAYRKGVTSSPSGCHNLQQEELKLGTHTISIGIAETEEERRHGLAGCTEVPEGHGLYFPYREATAATFWMKGMLIPIDIIWIADGSVVGIDRNVPEPPDPSMTSDLPLYHAPRPIDGVLEVAAGQAKKLDVTIGTPVELTP